MMKVRIKGVPYGHRKTRGRVWGPAEWSKAVEDQTSGLRPISGPCRVKVTFYLPLEKYPGDHPHGTDLDNLLKRLFDALQRTVFRSAAGGDGCVVEVWARKVKVESRERAGADLEIAPVSRGVEGDAGELGGGSFAFGA